MSGFNWGRYTVTGLSDQGGTNNSPTAWETIDVNGASYFNGAMSDAAAVIIRVENTGADLAFGCRASDSTDSFYQDVRAASMFDVVMGLEDAGAGVYNVDIAVETAASFNIYIVGWIGSEICYMNTNAQSIGGVTTATTYEDETVTSQGGDTAKVAFFQFNSTALNFSYAARHADESTYDPYHSVYREGFGSVSLNASEQFSWQCSSTTPVMYINGYLKGADVTSVQSPTDRNSGLSDGTYGTITSPTADYVAYLAKNISGDNSAQAFAARDTGDSNDDYGDHNRGVGYRYTQKITAIEAKLEDVSNQELFEIWYGSNPTGGGGGSILPLLNAYYG